jgi:hypothetical protein
MSPGRGAFSLLVRVFISVGAPVAVPAISLVPAGPTHSPATGIGTELLAHRDKIQVTRGPAHILSVLWCRLDTQIAMTYAQFPQFPGESLQT